MLALSTKYALRALLCLVQSGEEDYVRVSDLSERAGVPGPYLSKIIKALAEKEIVLTRRGLQGGVRLNPGLDSLSFFRVCEALDDPITNQLCLLSQTGCNAASPCSLHHMWGAVRKELHQFLHDARVF